MADQEEIKKPSVQTPAETEEMKQIAKLKDQIIELEKQRDEYLDGWKRAKADLINYKREEMARAESLIKFSNESLLRELITIMDSFDLALAVTVSPEHHAEKGIILIKSQLETFLKQNGVEAIKSVEQQFNPAFHESIEEVESDKPPGTVIEEVSRGWQLHGKVIRPARVKVAKQLSVNNPLTK